MAAVDGRDPFEAVEIINSELAAYQGGFLQDRPQLLVANKMDLPEAREHLARFEQRRAGGPLSEQQLIGISCATGEGISALLEAVWAALASLTPTV
jgi:GTP-binding protein